MARKTQQFRKRQIVVARERREDEIRELLKEYGIELDKKENEAKVAKVGRKRTIITNEMKSDVTKLSQDEFISKYGCTELIYLRTFKEAFDKPEEKIVEKHWLDGIIPSPETLDKIGVNNYMTYLHETIQQKDQAISDILHHLEIKGATLSTDEKIKDVDLLIKLRNERREFKDGKDFMNENRDKVTQYLQAQQKVINIRKIKENRKYNVKQLVKMYGEEVK